jgi:uroporphyrinogen-III decarboxylase
VDARVRVVDTLRTGGLLVGPTEFEKQLSPAFSIDPNADWVTAHNREAREVLAAYREDRALRVPVLCSDEPHIHGFYMDEERLDYRDYYSDPDTMMTVQLEAARRRRELVIWDWDQLGVLPESWPLCADMHPVQPFGWVGCEVQFRQDCVPAHIPLRLEKEQCRDMRMPDPRTGGILAKVDALYRFMQGRAEDGIRFLGRPVGPVTHSVGHPGLFSLALNIRGEELMSDMYDDPAFVHDFLHELISWIDELQVAWNGETARRWPMEFSDHGIEMLSPELYERFVVAAIVQANAARGGTPGTNLHHCGSGVHLFPVMKSHFGLTRINAITFPLIDIAKLRADLGPEVWIDAGIADQVLMRGPPETIRQTVKDLMESGAKGEGRLSLWVGDMLRGTPLEHFTTLYESVKEFGGY